MNGALFTKIRYSFKQTKLTTLDSALLASADVMTAPSLSVLVL